MEHLNNYKHSDFCVNLNFFDIPVNVVKNDDEGMMFWNDLIAKLIEKRESGELATLVRTPSGGISISAKNWGSFPGYDVQRSKSYAEITLIDEDGCWRFQFRRNFKEKEISGRTAYLKFEQVCKKFDIDLKKFYLGSREEGESVKRTIPKAHIDITPEIRDMTFENAHHLDIHSAFMAGVAKAYPELKPPIQHCYENRKKWAIYKHILTHCWGYMQSDNSPVYYRLSHLSKAGIEYVNAEIERLSEELTKSDRYVLLHNIDGIWYAGELYHGQNEGTDLGQWSNDIENVTFRAKSPKAYEYIDAYGIYHVKLSGKSKLDYVKPREEWEWGDIYGNGASKNVKYACDEDGYIVRYEEEI